MNLQFSRQCGRVHRLAKPECSLQSHSVFHILCYFKFLLTSCTLSLILNVIGPKIAAVVVNVHFRHQTGAMRCKLCGLGSSCSWLWVSWSTGQPQHKPPRSAPWLAPLQCVFCCSMLAALLVRLCHASYIYRAAVVCTAMHMSASHLLCAATCSSV